MSNDIQTVNTFFHKLKALNIVWVWMSLNDRPDQSKENKQQYLVNIGAFTAAINYWNTSALVATYSHIFPDWLKDDLFQVITFQKEISQGNPSSFVKEAVFPSEHSVMSECFNISFINPDAPFNWLPIPCIQMSEWEKWTVKSKENFTLNCKPTLQARQIH